MMLRLATQVQLVPVHNSVSRRAGILVHQHAGLAETTNRP